jgi:hypothetical protein
MPRLRTLVTIAGVTVIAILAWVTAARSQPPPQVPGLPSPGAAAVRVVNDLTVRALQAGPWQVSLAPGTSVALAADSVPAPAAPDFLRVGRQYLIQSSGGAAGTVTVERIDHGWVRVTERGAAKWLNLAQVVSVQDAQ